MPDFGTMQETLRALNTRHETMAGSQCPKGCCYGTLTRRRGSLVCTSCVTVGAK